MSGWPLAILALALGLAGCAAPRPAERAPVPPERGRVPGPRPDTAGPPAGWTPPAPDPEPSPEALWASVAPVVLPVPPWTYTLADDLGRRAVAVPRLTRMLEAPNAITDEAAWLARNGFDAPGTAEPSRPLPFLYLDAARLRVIEQPGYTLGVYGEPSAGRYLLVAGEDGTRRAFDFQRYLVAPATRPAEAGLWEQGLVWAAVAAGWLYVAHAHPTYAATTGGQNGYVTALDLDTGALRWRSRPLVANARTFAVVDDALVTGYGFTAEPDFLYVLDRFTGEVLAEAPVRTAPTWLLHRGDRLFVRAYDADYVFALR